MPVCYMKSPVGTLRIAVDNDGIVTELMFAKPKDVDSNAVVTEKPAADTPCNRVIRQLFEYFDGERTKFDLDFKPAGTAFRKKVWKTLTEIPYGETWTYGQVAKHIGAERAARAVGGACNSNPISIIIPCHRVVGSQGKLVGYGGGLDNKKTLLELESNR